MNGPVPSTRPTRPSSTSTLSRSHTSTSPSPGSTKMLARLTSRWPSPCVCSRRRLGELPARLQQHGHRPRQRRAVGADAVRDPGQGEVLRPAQRHHVAERLVVDAAHHGERAEEASVGRRAIQQSGHGLPLGRHRCFRLQPLQGEPLAAGGADLVARPEAALSEERLEPDAAEVAGIHQRAVVECRSIPARRLVAPAMRGSR